jgi:hypothetical protein
LQPHLDLLPLGNVGADAEHPRVLSSLVLRTPAYGHPAFGSIVAKHTILDVEELALANRVRVCGGDSLAVFAMNRF